MTYEPLHHKYRPQTFAELVGQEAIAATLTNAIQQQRIAPAYLFTGARGTGKTSSARILAKSLNCLKSKTPTEKPCGRCEVCQAIARGSALDVIEIDAASNTGVDNIRELIERAQFAPVQCRYKVYIIDEVHMLSTAAFNALLKTLEEPPDRVVFVLATTDPQRVLPTIISRCQRFDYRRIPLDAMVTHLRYIADQEAIPITDGALTLVAQIAQGGLRDAESLLDQLSLLSGKIDVEQVWDLVGSVPERDLLELLKAIAQDMPETLLDSTRRLMDRGREPLIVLQNLASFYRDLLIAKTAPTRNDLVALTPPTWQQLCDLAQTFDLGTILAGQQHLRAAEVQLKHTTQPRLWLEVTLMGLLPSAIGRQEGEGRRQKTRDEGGWEDRGEIQNSEFGSADSPETKIPFGSTQGEQNSLTSQSAIPNPPSPTPSPQPQPPSPASSPIPSSPAPASSLNSIWQEVIQEIKPYSTQVMVRQQCQLLGLDGQQARLGVSSQPLFKMAQGKLPNIEAAFQKVFNRKIHITLEVAAVPPGMSEELLESFPPPPANSSKPNSAPPTPPPAKPTEPPKPRSETVPTPPGQNSPPSAPNNAPKQPTEFWEIEDEVTRAAKKLAEFFAGEVVNMSDETDEPVAEPVSSEAPIPPTPTVPDPAELDHAEDDDVPF
ncbi:MAG: DNA polymerase III subunit gamma/tau [Oscillatoriales cyanobacterium C42_A2020_001]|nr:DNA polymerase III subunit gamma/tau [Leptolyngbyaceae cyanobacterium C42_A2020_001]